MAAVFARFADQRPDQELPCRIPIPVSWRVRDFTTAVGFGEHPIWFTDGAWSMAGFWQRWYIKTIILAEKNEAEAEEQAEVRALF